MPKAPGGIDNQGQPLKGVGTPTDPAHGVPWGLIRYDIPFQCVGKQLSASEVIGMYVVPADLTAGITLPANLAGSIARALAAATASAAWTLTRIPAGSSAETTIATITFAANGTVATFSTQAAVTLAPGDMLRMIGPSSIDSTLADICFTIKGAR